LRRFIALFDAHVGYERRPGESPTPLHDARALRAVQKFAEEFKPHDLVLGGDILDCGVISHHNRSKPGRTEGLRLLRDMKLARELVIEPFAETLAGRAPSRTYHIGNHEDWINDLLDKEPGLEDLLDIRESLGLGGWNIIPQGGLSHLGPYLYFAHGDQIKGGEHVAKAAVLNFERSIRFGHHHTLQAYTKTSPVDAELPKTGVAVPCLCHKNPRYVESKPHRWSQGFLWGYVHADGTYSDYVSVIINGRFVANGKEFRG
jgi:hypothetical protein